MLYNSVYVLDTSQLLKKIGELNKKFDTAMMMYTNTQSKKLESYMKVNRPWTDRTGEAKRRLSAMAEEVPEGVQIVLSHGVSYGIWLELSHEKRYAIISPTIRVKSQEVMKGCQNLIDRIGK